jgi:hypothetical protein
LRFQSNSVLRRTVQFLLEPYSGLCNHSGTIVQVNTTRLRISIRTSTQDSTTGFPSAPDPTVPATSVGFSKVRPKLSSNYECLHT